MYVVVTGSRYYKRRDRIREVLKGLPSDAVIIHGAAKGADTLAGEEAQALGLQVVPVPADWDGYEDAGPRRNRWMLEMLLKARFWADDVLVLAFHEDPSLGRGTRNMVSQAEEAGIEVRKYIG